jgi:hypothetical protein
VRSPAHVLAAAAVVLAASCGWHTGLVAPNQASTVGVEIFETRRGLLERNLEPLLSDALTRAVVDFVDASLERPSRADVVVRGHIAEYRRRAGIRSLENELVETGLFVSVVAELIDRRTGEVLVPARESHVWSGYSLDENAQANEAEARLRALRHVAETLVLELFGPGASAPVVEDLPGGSPPEDPTDH